MSHFVDIVTMIKDVNALVRALGRVGFSKDKVELHEQADYLYGYQGDKRSQKANVILRRKYVGHASNDIGFERQKDGSYLAHISEYDHGKYGKEWQDKLNTYYGVEKAKVEFEKKGMKYFEEVDEKQRPRLRVKI